MHIGFRDDRNSLTVLERTREKKKKKEKKGKIIAAFALIYTIQFGIQWYC